MALYTNPEQTHGFPPSPMFDDRPFKLQRKYQDIILYIRTAAQPVRVTWPLVNGKQVPAKYIFDFLRKKELHWSCFCVLGSADLDPRSLATFMISATKAYLRIVIILVLPRLAIDLFWTSLIFHATTLEEEYHGLPTRSTGSASTNNSLLTSFSVKSLASGPWSMLLISLVFLEKLLSISLGLSNWEAKVPLLFTVRHSLLSRCISNSELDLVPIKMIQTGS
ncbi:hypothetical protein B0H13DRAFT_2308222 [Mycena leptocephala]|nr:hypothetical protein B0H13DRAFT_2308222 [Mycena leptocephala]